MLVANRDAQYLMEKRVLHVLASEELNNVFVLGCHSEHRLTLYKTVNLLDLDIASLLSLHIFMLELLKIWLLRWEEERGHHKKTAQLW